MPALGLHTCYIHVYVLNHLKMCLKSDFKETLLKLATYGQSDKPFLLKLKF